MDRTTIRRICWDGTMIELEQSIERDEVARNSIVEGQTFAAGERVAGHQTSRATAGSFIWREAATPSRDVNHENVNASETESRSWRIKAAPADTLQTQVCCLFSSTAFRLPGSSTAPQWPATSRADQ
jgi:hypothetical protein